MTPAYLTVRQAAQELQVCPATIYNMVERREIAHIRLGNQPGGALRIPKSALEDMVCPPSSPESPAGANGTSNGPQKAAAALRSSQRVSKVVQIRPPKGRSNG